MRCVPLRTRWDDGVSNREPATPVWHDPCTWQHEPTSSDGAVPRHSPAATPSQGRADEPPKRIRSTHSRVTTTPGEHDRRHAQAARGRQSFPLVALLDDRTAHRAFCSHAARRNRVIGAVIACPGGRGIDRPHPGTGADRRDAPPRGAGVANPHACAAADSLAVSNRLQPDRIELHDTGARNRLSGAAASAAHADTLPVLRAHGRAFPRSVVPLAGQRDRHPRLGTIRLTLTGRVNQPAIALNLVMAAMCSSGE